MGNLIITGQLHDNYMMITFNDRRTIFLPIFAVSFFAVIMSYDRQLGLTPNLAPVIVKFS